ncbi:hypothetical protein [Burkholderia cenocepacia]|uniref:Uncharacterized protein n=1 Tax=Burkholderia cenocepacia TaxID=95486 RepID=A0ABD4UCR4_9BURK|nr:hypothetical protein [Burkholderia cenocepacia]MCW3696333.1 hypothetical protein [Burkholderia cenocepacia]MCW3704448.1 hypothetical protein [Burkholderia cenocepacia]MCW3712113.1 hypothetical protein [Burkholderia cenocepacia]MCW3720112.1 hypothetical protein [Burkholderia cenocepacia]MCW3727824.1 hypothetical protein [Burkholderia cenocepacia]
MTNNEKNGEFDFFRTPDPKTPEPSLLIRAISLCGRLKKISVDKPELSNTIITIWLSANFILLFVLFYYFQPIHVIQKPAGIIAIEESIGHDCWDLDRAMFVGAVVEEQIEKRFDNARDPQVFDQVLDDADKLQEDLTKICSTKPKIKEKEKAL